MRLIDASKIMLHKSMIHNINGCNVVRVEDVQRLITEQPTAYDVESVINQIDCEGGESGHMAAGYDYLINGRAIPTARAIEIVKGGTRNE